MVIIVLGCVWLAIVLFVVGLMFGLDWFGVLYVLLIGCSADCG